MEECNDLKQAKPPSAQPPECNWQGQRSSQASYRTFQSLFKSNPSNCHHQQFLSTSLFRTMCQVLVILTEKKFPQGGDGLIKDMGVKNA